MHLVTRYVAVLLPLVLAAGPLPPPDPPDIRWAPDPPLQGSLILIVVQPRDADSTLPVTGALAGESLHFEPDGRGGRVALGAVPFGADDTIPLSVKVDEDEFATPLPVARRTVAREELRTAARFSRPPDSALAARLERERLRVREVLTRTHARPRLWSPPFGRPRPGKVRSGFGLEREYNGELESRHMGVDFGGRRGAPVRATNRGVVALVDNLFYSGRTIYIDHGAGLLTGYLHLDRALVAAGDTVQRGQVIGRVGATGRVTGPHLHWLARYGAILVDPLDLVNLEWVPVPQGPAR